MSIYPSFINRSPFDFSEISDGYHVFLERLSTKHRIKQALCCVCRGFRLIALELIYEYLFLRDHHDWERLVEGLERSNRLGVVEADAASIATLATTNSGADVDDGIGSSDHGGHVVRGGNGVRGRARGRRSPGPGWYVRRIDISTTEWTTRRSELAARVLRCCPNLRIVSFSIDATLITSINLPLVLVRQLCGSCARSLQSLEWSFDIGGVQSCLMLALIHRMKGLRSFSMCWSEERAELLGLFPEEAKTTLMPELHSLQITSVAVDPSTLLRMLAGWRFPKLRQVVITGQIDLVDAKAFFVAHGAKIRTLEFDNAGDAGPPPPQPLPPPPPPPPTATATIAGVEGETIEGGPGPGPVPVPTAPPPIPAGPGDDGLPSRGPAMILTRCPNLDDLVLHMHWTPAQALPGHPRVSRIGIRGLMFLLFPDAPLRAQPGAAHHQHQFLQHLGAAFQALVVPNRFPKLKVVRMLDFEQSCFQSLRWRTSSVAFWALWVRRFENMGIRLEDHVGEVVKMVFSRVNVLLPEDEVTVRGEGEGEGEGEERTVATTTVGLNQDLNDDLDGDLTDHPFEDLLR